MDELKEQVNEKVDLIEDFVALSLRREKVVGDALEILKEAKHLRDLIAKVEEAMQEKLAEVELQHGSLIKRMRRQQLEILDYILEEKHRLKQKGKPKELTSCLSLAQKQSDQQPNSLLHNMENLKLQGSVLTPKIMLSNNKVTPLVKRCRINPIPFVLIDFEYRVTLEQFNKIPKYMRGRETIDELNNFLDTVIIPCFSKKYQLMHRQRNTVRNCKDLELWKVYNQQVSYVPGRNFITLGDISQHLNKMLEKKQQNRIIMLRHLGVLQEQRVSQTICYIWAADTILL